MDLLNSTQFRDLLIDARNNSYRLRATAAGVSWSPYDDNTIRAAKGFSMAEVGIHPMCYDFTTRTPVTPQYDTDWQDELFSNAGIMRHNVSVIGGTKAIKYMASVGYMDQDLSLIHISSIDSTLIENPATYIRKKVPISDTGITIHGISVTRQLRRKRKIMMITSRNAS